jgi:1,4-dihydroxy-2-naphthoate octaprenyltransferase
MPMTPDPEIGRSPADRKTLTFCLIPVVAGLVVAIWTGNRGLAITFLICEIPMGFIGGYLFG